MEFCPQEDEDESGQRGEGGRAYGAADVEEGREAAGDVELLGHPRVAGAKLPGDEEADCG